MNMDVITLYHGSVDVFDVFSKDVLPRFDTGQNLLGHYFTESPTHVLNYARGRKGMVYVTEASFVSMKIVPSSRSGMCEIDRMQLDFNEDDFADYREQLIADGHDAVCFEGEDGYNEYVILEASQLTIVDRMSSSVFKRRMAAGLMDNGSAVEHGMRA